VKQLPQPLHRRHQSVSRSKKLANAPCPCLLRHCSPHRHPAQSGVFGSQPFQPACCHPCHCLSMRPLGGHRSLWLMASAAHHKPVCHWQLHHRHHRAMAAATGGKTHGHSRNGPRSHRHSNKNCLHHGHLPSLWLLPTHRPRPSRSLTVALSAMASHSGEPMVSASAWTCCGATKIGRCL